MSFHWLLVHFCAITYATDDFASKYIKIDSLDAMTVEDHHKIFTPITEFVADEKAKHNIHVEDIFGKFMKLRYEATHPLNIKILKLDLIKKDIASLVCDEDDSNTIEIEFVKYTQTESYYDDITASNDEYYIAGSYRWLCKDKNTNQYAPIIRKITSAKLDKLSNSLIFATEYASYFDLFEKLDLEFVTNAKMYHSQKIDNIASIKNRRRLFWLSNVWDDITSGIKNVVNHVTSWVEDIANVVDDIWDGVETVIDAIEGKTVAKNLTDNYFWSYNYDSSIQTSIKSFYLDDDDNVECISCYVYFDLTYTFKIRIEDRSLKYLYLVGEGDAKVFAEIELKASFDFEYDLHTPKIPLPYLSIGVFGIEFGFVVYGALGIGVQIEIDYIWFEYSAFGTIKRGIEYDGDTNTQNYIGEHYFTYDKQGPRLEFSSMNVTFYLKPTIYLSLNYIGAVYFGIQPEIEFTFTKDPYFYDNTDSSECAIDYVPTAKLLVFIGAEIKPLNIYTVWKKEASLEVAHAVLTSLEGCISHSELISLETNLDVSVNRRRRRMMLNDHDDTNCYLDYSNTSVRNKDRFYDWGSKTSQWSGNKTKLSNVCTETQQLNNGETVWPINIPNTGNLLIKVVDNFGGESMVGIYKTYIELYKNDGLFDITTNVTCLSRLQFTKTNTFMDYRAIDNYDIELLEWYCDLNMSSFGMDIGSELENAWIDMISLPSQMNAIILDSSFGNIMLFDDEWCNLFVLAKQTKYDYDMHSIQGFEAADWDNIKYYGNISRQWFGSYHCIGNNVISLSLYFESINWKNGTITARVISGDANDKQYLSGFINYSDFSLELWNSDKSLQFVGVITLLQDGTILYCGSVDNYNIDKKCTGFVIQGYMDTQAFVNEDITTNLVDEDSDVNCTSAKQSNNNAILIGICIGISVVLVLFVIGYMILRYYGYTFNKPQNYTTYQLMNEKM